MRHGRTFSATTLYARCGRRAHPGATAIHEFFGFVADCGQAAGEILYSWGHGEKPSGEHINRVVSAMQQAGLAGNQGVSTLQGNSAELTKEGVPNFTTNDWLGAIRQNAGVKPIELGVSNARVLPGDENTVFGHFLTIEGRTKSGDYIASDPDNAAAKHGQLVRYSEAQLAAAHPWGAIVPTQVSGQIGGGPLPPDALGPIVNAVAPGFGGVVGGIGDAAALPANIANAAATAIRPLVINVGLFTLALILIFGGLLLVFWEPVSAGVQTGVSAGTKAAKDAAGAAVLAA